MIVCLRQAQEEGRAHKELCWSFVNKNERKKLLENYVNFSGRHINDDHFHLASARKVKTMPVHTHD